MVPRPFVSMCPPLPLWRLLFAAAAAEAAGRYPFGKPVRDAYFQFSPGTVYFNHGGYGATPRPVQAAMMGYTRRMEEQPTSWFAMAGGGGYSAYIRRNRPRLARLVNASPDDLVYLDNASAGINAVLRSLAWRRGDIVLLVGSVYAVFPNTVAWLARQYGVRPLVVDIAYPVRGDDDYVAPVRRALRGLTEEERGRVRVAVFDHYSSYPSVLLPVVPLIRLIKAETAQRSLVFVDGAHALGHVAVDIGTYAAAGLDYYVMDGHKWFMSPHGSALLWAAPAGQAVLEADVISSEDGAGTPFHGRFDYIGTRDYGPWCAMGDAIDFREEALGGEERIVGYIHELALYGLSVLRARWGAEAAAPANMTGGLFTVGLPIPPAWPAGAQAACADTIATTLREAYKMQIIPFTIAMHNATTHVARISAQVYLAEGDFDDLAAHGLAAARTCSAAARAGQA